MDNNLIIVILAAGHGKRLGGKSQKVVHTLLGKPILSYLFETIEKLFPEKIIIVVGYKKEEVLRGLEGKNVEYVEQPVPRGTGDAVLQTKPLLENYNGDILILCGDVPFLTFGTLRKLLKIHRSGENSCTILTAEIDEPSGYGRIKREPKGNILEIVEEANASSSEKKIKEINTGVYVLKSFPLFSALLQLSPDPVKGEYYLTDVIKIFYERGEKISTCVISCPEEAMGINTYEDLKKAEKFLKRRSE